VWSTTAHAADTLIEMDRHSESVAVLYVETPGETLEAKSSAELVQKVLALPLRRPSSAR
jgi:hypothetical protein